MIIVLLPQVKGHGKVGDGSFMLGFKWGDRGRVSFLKVFFGFCAIVNCSFMGGT